MLEHAAQVNAWFTIAGAFIGAVFIAIVAQLVVNAVLEGMPPREHQPPAASPPVNPES